MEKKGFYTTLFVIVLGFVCLYLFSGLDIQLNDALNKGEMGSYNLYRIGGTFLLMIFGLLIEYKKVISIFQNNMHLNKHRLIVPIALLVLFMLPIGVTVHLGIMGPHSVKGTISFIINHISARSIISVLIGILFARAFSISSPKRETS